MPEGEVYGRASPATLPRARLRDYSRKAIERIHEPEPPAPSSEPAPAEVEAAPALMLAPASVLMLQRTAGNAAVARYIRAHALGGDDADADDEDDVGAGPRARVRSRLLVQRQPKPDDGVPDMEELRKELVDLNGMSMDAMLAELGGMPLPKIAQLEQRLETLGGVNTPRLQLALSAPMVKQAGGTPESFGIAHEAELTALGHQDQRDAILRFMGGGKWQPPSIELGDTVMDGKAIVHKGEVRVIKGGALTWPANNPGAIGPEPSGGGFKPPGVYPGKSIGPAKISIFPSEPVGFAAAVAWVRYKAAKGVTFKGFFSSHAPAPKPKDDPAAKKSAAADAGNDPDAYFKNVAKGMGKDPAKTAGLPLSAMDPVEVAKGLQTQEGWGKAGDSLKWDDERLPAKDRLTLIYATWKGLAD